VTLDGWYTLHQTFAVDRAALRRASDAALRPVRDAAAASIAAMTTPSSTPSSAATGGWSAVVQLVGSHADVLFIHFRPTLDALGAVQQELARLELMSALRPVGSFLGVTELGLYHLVDLDDPRLAEHVDVERQTVHTRRRLYPTLPEGMPYVSFYPTSKRRGAGGADNWYTLPLA
jgi:chlorite dismutase